MKKKKSKGTLGGHDTKGKGLSVGLSIAMLMSSALYPAAALGVTTDGSSMTGTYSLVNKAEHFGGSNRYETAAKIAQEGWQASEFAILAGGKDTNLVDALAAAPLAKLKNAPILLTESGGISLNKNAEAELKRLKTKTVYVVSGERVITKAVLDQLAGMGITVVKLGGDNRWETAVNIAQQMGDFTQVVVATGLSYADAASMASVAAAKGMPILLTDKNTLPTGVKTYLDEIKGKLTRTYVIGGEGIVSKEVMSAFPNPQRIAGANRYETNLAILQHFANELKPAKTYLANGQDSSLVDALVGSSLAALNNAPILLLGDKIPGATRDFAEKNLSPYMVALGGEKVLPTALVSQLSTSIEISQDGAIVGSDNLAQPKRFDETMTISGDKVKLENAILDHSVYVKGDGATLENVTVKGTVFLDPGEAGNANLNKVNASKIVVLSGAKESIHISNSEAGTLIVSSSNEVRVESSGSTKVGNTIVQSYAILDAAGGTLGTINVVSAAGQAPVVTLKGTFDQPIVVNGAVTLKADPSASIAKVEVAPENRAQKVSLEGNFKAVEVNKEANLNLGATANVGNLVTNAKSDLNVASGAKVERFDNKGQNVNVTGSGAGSLPPSGQVIQPSGGGSGSSEGDNGSANPGQVANEAIASAKALIPATVSVNATADTNLLTVLNAIEGMAAKGVTLSIASSSNNHVANDGALTFGKAAVTGNVVISIAKSGGTTDTKTIAVTVPVISDTAAVAQAKEALTFALIKGENTAADQIEKALNMISNDSAFTGYGVAVTWETTNPAINIVSGKVSRPSYEEQNVSGTLTAVLSKNTVTERKEFPVTVLKVDASVYEDNKDMEKATPITTDGVAQTHMISPSEEEDWFKFEAKKDEMYTIRTSQLIPEYIDDYAVDTVIEVMDASGERLAMNDDDDYGYGLWSRLDWVAPADGHYYIKVADYSTDIGQYDIAVNKVAPQSIIQVSADVWDYNELYIKDEILDVYVIFSENVKVTGIPRVKLATGAEGERYATYKEGSGTKILTFEYTVQADDRTAHLETAGTALDLNGGSIKTLTDKNVVLNLPEPGSLNSLGANVAVGLNTVLPEYLDNDDLTSIAIELNGTLREDNVLTGLEKAFTVSDLSGTPYEVTAVQMDGEYDRLILKTSDFSNSKGRLRVSYDGSIGNLTDQFGNNLKDFTFKFTPDLDVVDLMPPSFDDPYPIVLTGEDSSLSLVVRTDEAGKGYYVILPAESGVPSADQVMEGKDAEGNLVEEPYKGQFELVEEGGVVEVKITLNGLDPSEEYNVFVVSEDLQGNRQEAPTSAIILSLDESNAWVSAIQWVDEYLEEGDVTTEDALENYLIVLQKVKALSPEKEFNGMLLTQFEGIAENVISGFLSDLEKYYLPEISPAQLDKAYDLYDLAISWTLAFEEENNEEWQQTINTLWNAFYRERPTSDAVVSDVTFLADTDTDFVQIAGEITWTAITSDNVEGYKVYFVDANGIRIGEPVGVVKDVAATSFTIPENTEVPGSISSIGVYAYNAVGDSAFGSILKYDKSQHDEDSASSAPQNVEVTLSADNITIDWVTANWASAKKQSIYILPTATDFNIPSKLPIAELEDNEIGTWEGDIADLRDSLGNPLQSGQLYKAYVVASTNPDSNYYIWTWRSIGKEFEFVSDTGTPGDPDVAVMNVSSGGITGGVIDGKYVGGGMNDVSLPVSWTPVEGAQSYALVLYDMDAVFEGSKLIHWLVVNIPNTVVEIAEDVSGESGMPGEELSVYYGPFPPSFAEGLPEGLPPYSHNYKLVVYALDTTESITVEGGQYGPTEAGFNAAIEGKVIGKGEITGRFTIAPAATNIQVDDIGDNKNGSDLSVTFDAAGEESLITGYKVIAIKGGKILSVSEAEALTAGRYKEVAKGAENYNVTLEGINDSDGEAIVEGVEYQIFILSVKNPEATQVSTITTSGTSVLTLGTAPIGGTGGAPGGEPGEGTEGGQTP